MNAELSHKMAAAINSKLGVRLSVTERRALAERAEAAESIDGMTAADQQWMEQAISSGGARLSDIDAGGA